MTERDSSEAVEAVTSEHSRDSKLVNSESLTGDGGSVTGDGSPVTGNDSNDSPNGIPSEVDERVSTKDAEGSVEFDDAEGPDELSEMSSIDSLESIEPKKVKFKQDPEIDAKLNRLRSKLIFGLCVVDFHHVRGPELEYWIDDNSTDDNEGEQLAKWSKVWAQLPFQALPDGAHLFDETFTNFTLLYDDVNECCPELPLMKEQEYIVDDDADEEIDDPYPGYTSLFGCACIRQMNTEDLIVPSKDETRSVIQKSVVLITRYPITIQLKEKLGIITKSYFEQRDFTDRSILKALYDNVSYTYNHGFEVKDEALYDTEKEDDNKVITESDFYSALDLRDVVLKLKRKLLVIFKALLLEKRVLVFCKDLNTLSNLQYGLLSLIPNLIMSLSDCACPLLDKLSQRMVKPTSLSSSNRGSMLKFIGMPLQLFNRGGFYEPFLTLQQLDYLANSNTKSFLVGSSNDILLERKEDWFDLVLYVNTDQEEPAKATDFLWGDQHVQLEIMGAQLKEKLTLTSPDKRFIDNVVYAAGKNKSQTAADDRLESKTLNMSADAGQYQGGDDFIRNNFEDYLIGMLSTLKYDRFLTAHASKLENELAYLNLNSHDNEIVQFNAKFIESYKTTRNFKIFARNTDDELFNFFEPSHVGVALAKEQNDKRIQKLRGYLKWSKGAIASATASATSAIVSATTTKATTKSSADCTEVATEDALSADAKSAVAVATSKEASKEGSTSLTEDNACAARDAAETTNSN